MVGFLGVSQLMAFPHRTDVTVRNKTVKCDPIAVILVHLLQAALIEVTQPPLPHLGISHRIHRHLLSCVSICTEVFLEGVEIVARSAKWHGDVARLQPGSVDIENRNDALPRCCFY